MIGSSQVCAAGSRPMCLLQGNRSRGQHSTFPIYRSSRRVSFPVLHIREYVARKPLAEHDVITYNFPECNEHGF